MSGGRCRHCRPAYGLALVLVLESPSGPSLDLLRDRLIVFTGLSGSGKSSLAFDTIYAEGQRRYVESLSAYDRHFLGQRVPPATLGSTVGAATEVYDHLRLLYACIGVPRDHETGERIIRRTSRQIVDRILTMPEGRDRSLAVLAATDFGNSGAPLAP